MISRIFSALATIVLAVLVAVLTCLALLWRELPPLDRLGDAQACVRERANGYRCSQVKVKIENVPALLKQAIIAAEDEHFYEHKSILGEYSTITVQVARNFFMIEDRQRTSVLSEFLWVFKIEFKLSKDQILELYVNNIYLGNAAYGFEAAAQSYFGKPLTRITLAEAAMLAGLPKAPSAFNPLINPTRAKKRQQFVLERMLKAGVISDEQFQQALQEEIYTKELDSL
jgi:penicillin-binding protein 1A